MTMTTGIAITSDLTSAGLPWHPNGQSVRGCTILVASQLVMGAVVPQTAAVEISLPTQDGIVLLCDGTDAGGLWVHGPVSASESQEPADSDVVSSAQRIMSLKRLSGLTWEQVGRLFGVDRRSVHYWASGRSLGPGNEEWLGRLLSLLKTIDRGAATENRNLLLTPLEDGRLPLDLLGEGHFGFLLEALGRGPGRREPKKMILSEAERAARRPPAPEILVGALQDPLHKRSARRRVVPLNRRNACDES